MTDSIIARALLAGLAAWIPWAALNRETSLPALWRSSDGIGALPFLFCLVACACAIALDVILNETTRRKLWRWIMPRRDSIYLAIAFLSILTPFSQVKGGVQLPSDVIFFYTLIFAGGMGLFWADAKAKRDAT